MRDYYDDLVNQRGLSRAYKIVADDQRKLRAHAPDVEALVRMLERCENHLHACNDSELLEDLQIALAAYREAHRLRKVSNVQKKYEAKTS